MATIKSYTELPQSETLSKILSIESADMWYSYYHNPISGASYYEEYPIFHIPINKNKSLPCWSLAALLSILPEIKGGKPVIALYDNYITYPHISDLHTKADSPVDACVAMIENLHELKLM